MVARSGFSSKFGFIAAAAGSAVGLGNIWKFPYEAGENGGAAFLLVYGVCMLLIGFPVMAGEIALGRNAQTGAVGAYGLHGGRNWRWAGVIAVLCGVMILSFYNVVAGWTFGYFIKIGFGDLLASSDFSQFFGTYVADIWDNLAYSLVFMILTAIIVVRGVQGGIETASKILMPLLFILLLGLIGYALTLDNAIEGLRFYLLPRPELITLQTVYAAMGQAFFSLSLGMGILITYGSYISRKENLVNTAIVVTLADLAVAFLAGLLIFPLVFTQGGDASVGQGPGLVFVALPAIFQQMGPIAGRVIGGGFFLLLCMAALTSTISLLEVPVSYMVDQRKWPRKTAVWVTAMGIFVLGLPSMLSQGAVEMLSAGSENTGFLFYEGQAKSFFDLIDDVFSQIGLPLGGFLLSVFISYRWKTANFAAELDQPEGSFRGKLVRPFIHFAISYLCPVVLGSIFLLTIMEKFFGLSLF